LIAATILTLTFLPALYAISFKGARATHKPMEGELKVPVGPNPSAALVQAAE